MVPIRQYRTFWEFVQLRIPEIKTVKVVSAEVQMQNFISEVQTDDVLLIAVIPSSETEASSVDDLEALSPCYIFVLKKTTRADMDEEDRFSDQEVTQAIMNSIMELMWSLAEDFDHNDQYSRLMRRLNLNKMRVDPEYDTLGCNGWSLSFTLKTKGMFNE